MRGLTRRSAPSHMAQSESNNVREIMRQRPAVHRLTCGAFVQAHFWLDENIFIVPLSAMGFEHGADYAVRYHSEIFGFPPDKEAIASLSNQGKDALPVIAFIYFPSDEGTPGEMERVAQPRLDRAEQLLSWITGDDLHDVAFLTATSERLYFRVVPPHSRRRMRLGPGNVGEALARNLSAISEAVDADERFAFSLSLYRDALHEKNKLFKIARLFSVLEALAYGLKEKDVGSRKAVKIMLGLEAGALGQINFGDRKIRYDRIELSGRLRDKLFHGARFRRDDLTAEWQDSFDVLTEKPDALIDCLMSDCELEFARWGNNASKARDAGLKKSV